MNAQSLNIHLTPKLLKFFSSEAERRGIPQIEKCVETYLEETVDTYENPVPYSMEELDESIREAKEDIRFRRGKSFKNAEEMFAALEAETE
ncbi:MAG: hypothetical protein IJ793_02165 [Opitutales bacterium]|nr:hypothetical protein [Opitutales bacterium]